MASGRASTPVLVDLENEPDESVQAGSSPTSSCSGNSILSIPGDLKTNVQDCLDDVESLGDFASFGTLERFIDPQIHIDGQPISLPLSEHDAQRIIQASHKAPFGKGSDTVIDPSVRNTWEIDRRDFQLRNPEWENYLHDILKRAAKELGVDPGIGSGRGIYAELYKMLLYEKGAMFKAHTDTEKIPFMFGTLVVCLPSRHTGGAVKVKHGKQSKLFRTETAAQSYICWYSDVKHEVTEVTSGYRWVLTYNLALISDPSDLPSADRVSSESGFLSAVLRSWRKEITQGQTRCHELIYMLENQYTDASLKLDTLKGADLTKAKFLKGVCAQTGFCFSLASLERTVTGEVDECDYDHRYGYGYYDSEDEEDEYDRIAGGFHVIDTEMERGLKLTRVVDLDGNEVGKDYDVEEENIIQEDPLEDRDPDGEDYEGYTGNAGAFATHWYRDTVILLMPREKQVDFFLRPLRKGLEWSPDPRLCGLMQAFMEKFTRSPKDSGVRSDLLQICRFAVAEQVSGQKQERFSNTLYGMVVKASVLLKEPDLVRCAALRAEKLPMDSFPHIGTLYREVGFAALHLGLNPAVDRLKTIHETYHAIKGVVELPNAQGHQIDWTSDIGQWAVPKLHDIIRRAKTFGKRDGEALVEIIGWQKWNGDIFDAAISCVKSHIRCTPFVVAFLRLFAAREGEMSQTTFTVFPELLDSVIAAFSLRHEPEFETRPDVSTNRQQRTAVARRAPIDGQHIAELLSVCLRLNLTTQTDCLLKSLISEARQVDVRDYQSMLLPFLKQTIQVLRDHNIPLTDVTFRGLYQSILSSYITRYVGKKPERGANWTLPNVKCGCGDCTDLNWSLSSPNKTVGRFPLSKTRRQHLHQMLDRSGSDCTHVTERYGSPQTLVVTNTHNNVAHALNEWKQRAGEARKWLSCLGKHNLEQLLCPNYEDLTIFRTIRNSQTAGSQVTGRQPGSSARLSISTNQRTPMADVSGRISQEASHMESCVHRGVKRKAEPEIIDLTSEGDAPARGHHP